MSEKYVVELFALPPYQPAYMHPAVPYLTAYLKENLPCISVSQRDLNTDSLEYLLGKDTIAPMRDLDAYMDFPKFLQAKKKISRETKEKTNGILAIERNTVTYDLRKTGEDCYSREGLLNVARNPKKNLYYGFFRDDVIPRIEADMINLAGISVSDQKQFVPAMALASMVKEAYGDSVKVVLGGNIITRNYDVLSRNDRLNRALFQYYDFLIHHEGEVPLTELAKRLMSEDDVEGVPQLIYTLQDGRVNENLEFVVNENVKRGCMYGGCGFCDIDVGYNSSLKRMESVTGKKFKVEIISANMPPPDFDGLVDGQWTPKPVLPYLIGYKRSGLDRAIEDLRKLSKKYDTQYFTFGDEEIAGKLLRDFVDKLGNSGPDIIWDMYGRIEPSYLDKSFCKDLYGVGCRFIQFGVESASQKVLNANKKGYEFGIAGQVLENTYEAGIMNHAFLLVGLPDDSLIEASKLFPFLEEYGKYLTTIKPIHYKVSKWSPIALHPEYGVKLDREGTPDLDVNLNFAQDSGIMSRHKSEAVVKSIDLWIREYHEVNPATSEYMYVQRLFVGRNLLQNFGKSIKPERELDASDFKAMRHVHNGCIEEIRQKTLDKTLSPQARKEYGRVYAELRSQKAPENLEEVLRMLDGVAKISF